MLCRVIASVRETSRTTAEQLGLKLVGGRRSKSSEKGKETRRLKEIEGGSGMRKQKVSAR